MDMLIIGNDCITNAEEETQMAVWSTMASPLIMGNDVRNISNASMAILLNRDAIEVSQDPLGHAGVRLNDINAKSGEVWARSLVNGDLGVAILNKGETHADLEISLDMLSDAGFWQKGLEARAYNIFEKQLGPSF